jgi:hypothetical protein
MNRFAPTRLTLFCQLVSLFTIFFGGAFATAVTIPAGTGTLTFTQTVTRYRIKCPLGDGNPLIVLYTDSGFSYKDSGGTVTTLSGTNQYAAQIDCNGSELAGPVTLQSTVLNIVHDTSYGPNGAVTEFQPHGYLNPKYVILGVTYAPPGPSSYVSYANDSTVSSTADTKATFASERQNSIKTSVNVSIKGWKAGASSTITNKYTQSSFTSSSTTVSQSTSLTTRVPGPSNPYVGLNHDYDIVWVWLNPVQLFTLHEDTSYNVKSVEWNGYGFSTLDQADMEVYPVYIGWLNGDIPMTPDQARPLQRAWAAGQIWPAGQGPALTGTDFQYIVQADPYWQCTPKPSACPVTVDGTRLTQTPLNQDLLYLQAPVGGQPITQNYTEGYTKISSQGQGASYGYSQTYAWEQTFGASGGIGKLFKIGFEETLSQSNTVSWTNQWDRFLTSTNSQTATASITGPPCIVSGSTCNPAYTGTTEFGLYEDNLFGTFMFYPLN